MNEIDRLQKLAGIVNEDGEPGVDYKSDTGEGDVEKQAVGHIDNERGMIMKNLSKIVKAQNYLDGARNYLDAELNSPRGDMPEEPETVDVEDPSGVS